jgi:HAMP domain-containing protein
MTAIESQLLQRLRKLPPNRIAEVVDFVEFLAAREERQAAAHRLGESLARMDASNLPPVTEDEVEEAVQGVRRERRQQEGDAPSPPHQLP